MEGLFQLFENNLINWVVLAIMVLVLWNKFMPGLFASRRKRIEEAFSRADREREEGQKFLAEQRTRIENAERDAEQILVDARRTAEQMKEQIAAQTTRDIAELHKKIDQQIATHRQMVIQELRSQAATVAVRIAEASLPGAITPNVKNGLQDRFIAQLDSLGSNK